jgi:hypothetical protein
VVGIKLGKPDKKEFGQYPGLVRRPASLKASIMNKFMSVDGVVPNVAVALLHHFLILIPPLVTPGITFLALCEMSRI